MYVTVFEIDTSSNESPSAPQNALKEDPNHLLDTAQAVSSDETIDASRVGQHPGTFEISLLTL